MKKYTADRMDELFTYYMENNKYQSDELTRLIKIALPKDEKRDNLIEQINQTCAKYSNKMWNEFVK